MEIGSIAFLALAVIVPGNFMVTYNSLVLLKRAVVRLG